MAVYCVFVRKIDGSWWPFDGSFDGSYCIFVRKVDGSWLFLIKIINILINLYKKKPAAINFPNKYTVTAIRTAIKLPPAANKFPNKYTVNCHQQLPSNSSAWHSETVFKAVFKAIFKAMNARSPGPHPMFHRHDGQSSAPCAMCRAINIGWGPGF